MNTANPNQWTIEEQDLPGLRTLLDSVQLTRRVYQFQPQLEGKIFKVSYIRYKPKTSCLVAFYSGNNKIPEFFAKAFRTGSKVKIQKAGEYSAKNAFRAAGTLIDEKDNFAIYFFPCDPGLKSLEKLFNPEKCGGMLKKTAYDPNFVFDRMETLKYKPERRFVAKIFSTDNRAAVLKIYLKKDIQSAKKSALAFSPGKTLRIPRLLGDSEEHSSLLFEWMHGLLLDLYLNSSQCGDVMKRVGVALAELHQQKPEGLARVSTGSELSRWVNLTWDFERLSSELTLQIQRVAGRLSDHMLKSQFNPAPIHGDFYSSQVMVQEDGIAIIDMDRSMYGDPAFDLGLFFAHLERKVIFEDMSPAQRDLIRDSILQGYQSVAKDDSWSARLDYQTANGLLRLSPECFRKKMKHWHDKTRKVLDRAEYFLNQADRRQDSGQSDGAETSVAARTDERPDWILDPYGVSEDTKMGFVRYAIDPAFMEPKFASALTPRYETIKSCSLDRIEVVKYKPRRRCLIEYRFSAPGTDGPSLFSVMGKIRARGLDHASFNIQSHLWKTKFGYSSEDAVRVPEPLGRLPELHMWLYRRVDGVPLSRKLNDPEAPALMDRVAQGISKLHKAGIMVPKFHTLQDELTILSDRLNYLAGQYPQIEERLNRVLDSCTRMDLGVPPIPPTGIHRDFYPDQVLVGEQEMNFIDFDLYCVGDRGLDIGNFLGHVKESALREHGNPDHYEELEGLFTESYLKVSGVRARNSIKTYLNLTLARHIFISTLFPERKEFTLDILEVTEKRLNIRSKQKVFT